MAVKTKRQAKPIVKRRTFEKLQTQMGRTPRGICSSCGDPSTHQISIASREIATNRGPGKHVASTSRNFCEECAVDMFEEVSAIVRQEN